MTTALVQVAPAHVTARATIAVHSRSFALASRVLAPGQRDDVAVLYTWCRRADDAVDLVDVSRAPAALATLHAELDDAWQGRASDPVMIAFGALVKARAIPRGYADELLAGLAMDAADTRYQTFEDLFTYCWRVAGVVGLMMSHVFGVRDDDALVSAAHLGIGMQLTNVCRDVAEDWERGRLYVPDELCARHGAAGLASELGRPLPRSAHAPLAASVRELLALADRYYRSGDRGLAALPWRAGLAVRAARRVYAAIGRRIARQGHDVTAPRAVVPTAWKLAHVGAALGRALVGAPRLVVAAPPRIPARVLELRDVPIL